MEVKCVGVMKTSSAISLHKGKHDGELPQMVHMDNQYIRNESKVWIYKAVIRPVLLYAAATRSIRQNFKNKIPKNKANDGGSLRRIANKMLTDR